VLIKVLFAIVVLCTLALVGVAIALYVHVKRHIQSPEEALHQAPGGDQGEASPPQG